MNRISIIVSVLILLVIGLSCEKGSDPADTITELTLSVSKQKILDDNRDAVTVIVTNQSGKDVSDIVTLLLGENEFNRPEVTSPSAGVYDLVAVYNEIVSNSVEITVVEDIGLEYNKVVLIEQFTATWCQYCPRAIGQINDVIQVDNEITHVAYHLDDQFAYSLNATLFQHFGFSGIPALMADRSISWDGSLSEISTLHKPVRVGLEVEMSGSSSELNVDVTINFGKLYADNIRLALYLVEDGLIADQSNYYNNDPSSPWYQMGSPIPDLVHESIMIATLTNLLGDNIPKESIDIGSVFEKSFTASPPVPITSQSPWITDINKAKVVAVVTYGSGELEETVINSLACKFGETAESEMVTSK